MISHPSRCLLILVGVLTPGAAGVPVLCHDTPRIERQRALEQFDRPRAIVTRGRLRVCGASPEDVIQLIYDSQ